MPLKIDRNKCLACGVCAERCLLDNIRIKPPPCQAACPLGVNGQAYATLVALGRDTEALGFVSDGVAFPKTLARVCPRPCERACTRGRRDKAVALRAIKRFVTDAQPPQPHVPANASSGLRVAVVGAGPAGLQAAFELRMQGHAVVVLEARSEAGGAMRDIPNDRLSRDVLDGEIGRIVDRGVEMLLGQPVGEQPTLAELREDYDAVVLAVGAGAGALLGGCQRPRIDPLTLETETAGVFAARASGSIVEAMAEGRRAAESADRYLLNRDIRAGRRPAAPANDAAWSDEPSPVLSEADARREAQRCLRCGRAYERYEECWYCLPCEIECPTGALELKLPFLVS